jgi:hypothetical protein
MIAAGPVPAEDVPGELPCGFGDEREARSAAEPGLEEGAPAGAEGGRIERLD